MSQLATFVERYVKHPILRQRISAVLESLPTEVVQDILNDGRFTMVVYDPRNGPQTNFHIPLPGVGDEGSRMIAWKVSLAEAPLDFANYVIAHEFAHAYLRNRGRTHDEDPEDAADALAAEWGYDKPLSAMRFTWWRRA
ncbi:hypothetical protein L0337_09620 [candidate division KSB1 bacterium]|nr:hypothetical protein [candidate division KSB1 bacterium]